MTIASFCHDLLMSEGPLPLAFLAERVTAAGLTKSRYPLNTVKSALRGRAVELGGDVWASPIALLDGRCLTTRQLTIPGRWDTYPYEDADRYPAPDLHDLAPLTRAARLVGLPVRGGGTVHGGGSWSVFSTLDLARIPTVGDEQALCFRIERGMLDITAVTLDDAARARGQALATALGPIERSSRRWSRTDELDGMADDLTDALWALLAADPAALREPVPPLSECVSALAVALRRRAEQALARPATDLLARLPRDVQAYIEQEARYDELAVDVWLEEFITRTVRHEDLDLRHGNPDGFDEDDWLGDRVRWMPSRPGLRE